MPTMNEVIFSMGAISIALIAVTFYRDWRD